MTDLIVLHSIGEEDSADLHTPAGQGLLQHLTTLANDALRLPLRLGEDASWDIGPDTPVKSTEDLFKLIDRGTYEGGPTGSELLKSHSFKFESSTSTDMGLQGCGHSTQSMEQKDSFEEANMQSHLPSSSTRKFSSVYWDVQTFLSQVPNPKAKRAAYLWQREAKVLSRCVLPHAFVCH